MKKLNNKGLTAIEVLVCFAIISVIVISMLNIVNNYKNKQSIESDKSSITTYKTTLTSAIYDDIIDNRGITNFSIEQKDGDTITNPSEAYKESTFSYLITLTYISGKSSTITIYNKSRCIRETTDENGQKIKQSDQDCTGDSNESIDNKNSVYYISFVNSKSETDKFPLPKVSGLKYNDINVNDNNGIITIRVGLWHSELGTKYDVLNIVTPNVRLHPGML